MKKISDKVKFASEAGKKLINIINSFEKLSVLKTSDFQSKNTILVNVDLINGFCKKGNLSSDRVGQIIPHAVRINGIFRDFTKIFLVDYHHKYSEEFNAFPEHCLLNSEEAEVVDELKSYIDEKTVICHKNSVNGFLCKDYSEWIGKNPDKTNIIVLGDVTDICVMNFCLTQKAFFNEWNIPSRIIVPLSGVETFDLDAANHYGDLMNLFSLYNMRMNGIEIVEDIEA